MLNFSGSINSWLNLSLGLLIGSLMSFSLGCVDKSLAGETGFDRAVQEVGGIRKGQISYLDFSDQFNPDLHDAIQEEFGQFLDSFSSKVTYSYAEFDLNGDGQNEIFVKINAPFGYGSGGAHTFLFQLDQDKYTLINTFLHQVSLVVLPNQTSGWRDIFVVPGKIFDPNYGEAYSVCSYSPRHGLDNVDNFDPFDSLSLYSNCGDVQRNSTIDGVVIYTAGPDIRYHEFAL
ncbi:MAG: hypothetical protein EA366_01260 [Spirulina sp. DLM2.Bin59]|nr:MAG: hypothetical protein EA366_01260 [Spirulina sp. DLM2.Bin59]